MVLVADDFGAWLIGLLADAGRRRLTTWVLGSEQDRALRQAATAAVEVTAAELCPEGGERAEEVARVLSQVFSEPVPGLLVSVPATLLQALQMGVAEQLAVLGDAGLTGTGKSSAELLGVPPGALTENLTSHLVRQIVARGARGGPLAPLANQLNHDATHLQGQRLEGMVGRIAEELRVALARLDSAHALATPPVALAQLPAVTAGFTGRDRELAEIAELLNPSAAVGALTVSAVAGLAGVGKTTLAVAAGHAARERGWYPGGVLFIDLHGYDEFPIEPAQALDALLRALGIPGEHIPAGLEPRIGLYRSVLAQSSDPMLIIADNASSEAQVRPLLPGTARHRVVITSRHTLAGLDARLVDITVLGEPASMTLLNTALQEARPGDMRISSNHDDAVRLAHICGGLPLALQIVAALLKADPARQVSELAERLAVERRRLEMLRYDDGSGVSAPSVAAAFEMSYVLLDETTARMFRLLSLNPGPEVSTASAAILTGIPVNEARDTVANLVKAHLLEAASAVPDRWRMHDLLRLYAHRLSEESINAVPDGEARDRLFNYYVSMTEAATLHLLALPGRPLPGNFTGRDGALAWFDAERSTLVPAVGAAAALGNHHVALRLSTALIEYLSWRRYADDWIATSTIGLKAARALGDRNSEGGELNNLGLAYQAARRFEEAVTAHQGAADIARETGNRHGEGMATYNLGMAVEELGRYDEAITAYQLDLKICRETGDRRGEGTTLNALSVCFQKANRVDEAVTISQKSVTIHRDIGYRHGEGLALSNLASALSETGQLAEAITTSLQALAVLRETRDQYGEGRALLTLAALLSTAGRSDEAINASEKAAAIFRDTGDRHSEADALMNSAAALVERQRFDEALTADKAAAAIFRETGDRHREGMAMYNIGVVLTAAQRFDEALTAHLSAITIFQETGDRHGEGNVQGTIAMVQLEAQRFHEAIVASEDAITIFQETGERHQEGTTLNTLGRALRAMGRFEEAIAAHVDAAAIFKETGDRHGEDTALENLELDRPARRHPEP